MNVKVRTVTRAVFPSSANHVFPGPSAPDGQSMFLILLNWLSWDDGDASIWASCKGIGTREDEKGVAPEEKGTLGLFVPFRTEAPWNEVMKEPAKKRLASDELEVMDKTLDCAPDTPTNGGCDHVFDLGSQIATEEPGDVNLPPTHTLLSLVSQNTASTSPLGPPDPRASNLLDEGVYDATFVADVASMVEKEPAK